jgi:hypothetical protein
MNLVEFKDRVGDSILIDIEKIIWLQPSSQDDSVLLIFGADVTVRIQGTYDEIKAELEAAS